MIHKILVPVDGSTHSRKALEFACQLAARFSAELSIIHVVERSYGAQTMVLGSSHVSIPPSAEVIEEAGRTVTDAATEFAREHGCEIVRADVASGGAAREILTAASENGVDTIVMGSRGLSDLGGLLMGSVSHKVGHLAECTCIVVR